MADEKWKEDPKVERLIELAKGLIDDAEEMPEKSRMLAERMDQWGTNMLQTVEKLKFATDKQIEVLEDLREQADEVLNG